MIGCSTYLDNFWPQILTFRKYLKLNPSNTYVAKRRTNNLSDDVKAIFQATRLFSIEHLSINSTIWISYRDFYGDITQRKIQINNAFVFNSTFYVDAYCYVKNEIRTFNMSRCDLALFRGDVYGIGSIDDLQYALYEHRIHKHTDFDYFCHPKIWGLYRNASVALRLFGVGNGHNNDDIFKIIFRFIADSSSIGTWKDWATNQKAVGAAALSELVRFNVNVPKINDTVILNGKFSKGPLREAIRNLS